MRVSRDTGRHTLGVVHTGRTSTHLADLTPGWTVRYTPGVPGGTPTAVPLVYADDTGMVYADDTTMEYAT